MLTESNTNLTAEGALGETETPNNWTKSGIEAPGAVNKIQERKEREHLLAMNQILARQVMEKSRLVAGEWLLLEVMLSPLCSYSFRFVFEIELIFRTQMLSIC